MEYLLYIVIWIMGAVYGWYARERHAKRTIGRFVAHVEAETVKAVNESVIQITLEKNNGIFYIWNKDTNDFMGQGKTRQELENALAKRYPDKKFALDPKELKVLNEST